MRTYKLKRIGQLLFATGALRGKDAIATFVTLVDTGSTYTIVPWERLLAIGFEPAFAGMDFLRQAKAQIDVFTAQVKVEE